MEDKFYAVTANFSFNEYVSSGGFAHHFSLISLTHIENSSS